MKKIIFSALILFGLTTSSLAFAQGGFFDTTGAGGGFFDTTGAGGGFDQAEEMKKAEEATKQAEADRQRQAEEAAKQAEEMRKAEEGRQAELARQAEEMRKQQEADRLRQAEEDKKWADKYAQQMACRPVEFDPNGGGVLRCEGSCPEPLMCCTIINNLQVNGRYSSGCHCIEQQECEMAQGVARGESADTKPEGEVPNRPLGEPFPGNPAEDKCTEPCSAWGESSNACQRCRIGI